MHFIVSAVFIIQAIGEKLCLGSIVYFAIELSYIDMSEFYLNCIEANIDTSVHGEPGPKRRGTKKAKRSKKKKPTDAPLYRIRPLHTY